MAWTQTLPDAPGVYWVRLAQDDPILVTVAEKRCEAGVWTLRPALIAYVSQTMTGAEFWNGPIQPPT